ncbi:ABC transporter G family member 11 [Vitis vinifera]|uniref:ABC transporter G family member 11 n=1 Tax=Vitis vinifera TaxID=29760 RepID=A0A438GFR7_VITVI|nr:ABC transporter G family member 11 [Vitis vinifera]
MPRSEKKERAETAIREMGLQDAINTRIGGLDQLHGRTIITSIHQTSSEVFALFDNLCLLSSGRTVYFGAAHAANEVFLLFKWFPMSNTSKPPDHFLKTINKDFEEDIDQGFSEAEEAIHILIKAYKSSGSYQQVQTQAVTWVFQEGGALQKKRSHAGFINQSLVLTRKSCVNMYRDLGYYWLRLAIYITLAFALGTIFYDLGFTSSSTQDRGAMLMYIASFLTFMSIGGFPSYVEDMKVSFFVFFRWFSGRERLNGHFGPTAFVVGNTESSVPYLLLISLIPGVIAYYLTGLQKGFDHFIYFSMVLFTCMMLVESLMMIVASIVPNFLLGIITGAGIQGLMILGGGFF